MNLLNMCNEQQTNTFIIISKKARKSGN